MRDEGEQWGLNSAPLPAAMGRKCDDGRVSSQAMGEEDEEDMEDHDE